MEDSHLILMIVREKEIIINQILLELKDKEDFIDESIKSDILKNDFSKIDEWIEQIQNNSKLTKFNRLLMSLCELKDNNPIVEIWDDFLVGHCHDFAVALNLLFGYKIGIIYGHSKGIFGEELSHLYHAFAIDNNNQAYDVEGQYAYESAINNYKTQINPKTGNVADEVFVEFFNNFEEFKSKFSLIENNKEFIIRAIKRVSSNPLVYYQTKSETSIISLPTLMVNKDYLPGNDKYYHFKEEKKIYQNFSSEFKKQYKNIGIWKGNSVHSTFNGFCATLGLGTYDFDIISIEFKINWVEKNELSDSESEENIINYFKAFEWDLLRQEVKSRVSNN